MMDHDFTPQEQDALGDLQPLHERLNQYHIPEPDTARLLATLKPILEEHHAAPTVTSSKIELRTWLQLAWSQTKILETPFWVSSIFLTLIGLLWGISNGSDATTLSLIILSPFIAVLGVAYIFRPATHTLWQLEQFSLYKPTELLYVRVIVILSLNILIATLMILIAWTQGSQIILWRLLLLWFSPLVAIMGLALYCSIRWNTTVAVALPLAIWASSIALGWRNSITSTQIESLNSTVIMLQLQASNLVLLLALIALLSGILLFYATQRELAR